MRRTLACTAAAVLVSATFLAGCSPNENRGGSNVGPDIDDPQVTEEGGDPADEPSADGATAEGTDG